MLRRPRWSVRAATADRAVAAALRSLGRRVYLRVTGALLAIVATLAAPVHASAANPITQGIANDMLAAFTSWVAAGATWVLGQVVALVQQGTAVNLSGGWFTQHYATMIALGSMIMIPMLLAAAVKAAFAGDPAIALRAAFVYLPLAMFGTFAAIQIVNMLLQIVDWASAAMSQTLNADYQSFAANISTGLNGGNGNSVAAPFVIFICAIFMVIFGLLVFIELLFRNAAIYATAVFIPLAMATLIFPSTARIAKRLIETLLALILLKFFIVAVLSVGVSAIGSQSNGGTFGTVLAGIVVLILAAVLPNLLIGLLPLVEGAAIATIAARHTTQQIIVPTSNQIYKGIRTQNEGRLSSGFGPGGVGAAAAGGAAGVALVGAAQVRHGHTPSALVSGGGLGGPLSGGGGPGGVTPIGGGGGGSGGTGPSSVLSGVGVGGAAATIGSGATAPSGGGIGGLSAKRAGGTGPPPTGAPGPPSAPSSNGTNSS